MVKKTNPATSNNRYQQDSKFIPDITSKNNWGTMFGLIIVQEISREKGAKAKAEKMTAEKKSSEVSAKEATNIYLILVSNTEN